MARSRMRPRPVGHPIAPDAVRVALPDVRQETDYSCGASCLQAVCKYYGVGPDHEWEYVAMLRTNPEVGTRPSQVVRVARKLGLRLRPFCPMSMAQLKHQLALRRPVLLLIQAWGRESCGGRTWRRTYEDTWSDGHWVVAIGFDNDGFFFEDPSLHSARGFLSFAELDVRWRDETLGGERLLRYGLVLWSHRKARPAYSTAAQPIR